MCPASQLIATAVAALAALVLGWFAARWQYRPRNRRVRHVTVRTVGADAKRDGFVMYGSDGERVYRL